MNDHVEQVVIHKDPKFQFAEGTPAEIVTQMPREIVNSLAEASFTNLSKAKVNSFVSKGNVVKLEEEVSDEGNYKAFFRTSALQNNANSTKIHPERVKDMEITPKEYTDQRIDSLEKSIDHRFNSTEKLLSEKMDHLASRLEGAINNQNTKLDGKIDLLKSNLDQSIDAKLNTFKEKMEKDQKESKRHTTNTTLTVVGIATAIIIGVLGFVI